jgi:hypothetical protein
MLMTISPHQPAPPHPGSTAGRHAAPSSRCRRQSPRTAAVALGVVVLVVGLAAAAVALVLPTTPAHRIDSALGQLRAWPSVTVDGVLTAGDADARRVDLRATITADGAATGTLERSDGGRAELAVGPGATLLRGNRRWWLDEPPVLAGQLTHRWISNAREEAVGQVAAGRLAPVALADALAVLRDPGGRTATDVVVDGVAGTAFARQGARLVVGDDGRPLAADIPLPDVRAGGTFPTEGPGRGPTSSVALTLTPSDPADDAAARRAVADVLAQLGAQSPASVPSQDEIEQQAEQTVAGPPVTIQVAAEPGCRPSGCRLTVGLTNLRPVPTRGLFVLRVSGELVRSEMLTLPPSTRATLTIAVPAEILATAGGPTFTTKASFDLAPRVVERPDAARDPARPGRPIVADPYRPLTVSSRPAADRDEATL